MPDQPPPIPSKKHEHCQQRSQVKHDIEPESQGRPTHHPGDDYQVRRAADGKELGKALEESKKGAL